MRRDDGRGGQSDASRSSAMPLVVGAALLGGLAVASVAFNRDLWWVAVVQGFLAAALLGATRATRGPARSALIAAVVIGAIPTLTWVLGASQTGLNFAIYVLLSAGGGVAAFVVVFVIGWALFRVNVPDTVTIERAAAGGAHASVAVRAPVSVVRGSFGRGVAVIVLVLAGVGVLVWVETDDWIMESYRASNPVRLRLMLAFGDRGTQHGALSNPRIGRSIALARAQQEADAFLVQGAVRNPALTADDLEQLLRARPEEAVRIGIASNPSARGALLERICADACAVPDVLYGLARNPSTPAALLPTVLEYANKAKVPIEFRRELQQRIAENPMR